MSLGTSDVAHVLVALAALLVAAHVFGSIFASLRQPRVIGEILGGLLLGPTLLGAIAPGAESWMFPASGPSASVLGAVYQLGLLLLMFCAGVEIRGAFNSKDSKTVGAVFGFGMIIPFLVGLLLLRFINEEQFYGPNATYVSFLLVFAIAMAVTSIPVISRIMYDLGILSTPFARIVLSVAVIEDVVLYVVLAIALGIVAPSGTGLFGLPGALGFQAGSGWDMAYHSVVTIGVLVLFLAYGPRLYRAASGSRFNLVERRSPVAYQLLFMLALCIACVFLGVQAFFGAFVAGIVVGVTEGESGEAVQAIKDFSFAFFIPIYFAIVGLQLDLLHGFSVPFFLFYLAVACLVKAGSVYAGARFAGEGSPASLNLAVAMNARGGPGIVLASVAYAAGIVGQPFYAVLVMLAVLTSLFAGAWLDRVPKDRLLPREMLPAAAIGARGGSVGRWAARLSGRTDGP